MSQLARLLQAVQRRERGYRRERDEKDVGLGEEQERRAAAGVVAAAVVVVVVVVVVAAG